MKRKVAIETLGCRYNRLESDEIAFEMEQAGYTRTAVTQSPDVVVINTCTVTAKSDSKCRAAIRRAKSRAPKAVVVVAGCYAEISADEALAVKGADIVVGNAGKHNIATAVHRFFEPDQSHGITKRVTAPDRLAIAPVTRMSGRTNVYINIQTGCDELCSFCIVRVARGKSRSATVDDVITQVKRLVDCGVKEVVLSGINIGQFGQGRGSDLAHLIKAVLGQTRVERIRLSSINPDGVTDELIQLMADESPRFSRHLHIPLQSGSQSVLRRMRRPYTADMYEKLLDKLVTSVPDIGIGADVMVGFPGETDEEFEATVRLVERSPMMMCHVFSHSPRKGTQSYHSADSVSSGLKKERSAILKQLSDRLNRKTRDRYLGKTLGVLIENARDEDGRLKGFTDNYLPVVLDGADEVKNSIRAVRMISSGETRLSGRLEPEE